ncbi:MAG: SGNH/GDSL hydrolase family protein [Sandaracinaceae bacterium]|nr:SGNH/GDSL hydrolase family protein [Sandaracinaceae bacterium]
MIRPYARIIVIAILLATSAAARAQQEPEHHRVFILGDSQGEGMGPHLARSLRSEGHEVQLLAHHGWGAVTWTNGEHWADVRQRVAAFRPDTLVLIFGTNDSYGTRFREALDRLATLAPRVVWVGSPSYLDPARQARADAMIEGAQRGLGNGNVIDSRPMTPANERDRRSDRVHLTPAAARAWAERVAPRVEQALRIAPTGTGPEHFIVIDEAP